jgi:hypothetical protein
MESNIEVAERSAVCNKKTRVCNADITQAAAFKTNDCVFAFRWIPYEPEAAKGTCCNEPFAIDVYGISIVLPRLLAGRNFGARRWIPGEAIQNGSDKEA